MIRDPARRVAAVLAGLWAGLIIALAFIAAPAAFAGAAPDVAGRVAGHMFAQEAYLGLGLSLLLLGALRRRVSSGSVLGTDMLLVLAALFCTVLGYFALQPMMVAAKAGQGTLSFAALHGVSAGAFVLKGLLLLTLAWRLSAA